ncbi:MAG: 2,3-bisphosphoglycerate-independent phosphoglycerate mutase [Lentisphaerae bacterium]|nr:2,3-bisphosphoglycerate-independent phosphoglycerate mutase [Lentisphaerota bacterium]MBT4819953.1 2,3-bisphosphoglycerate-independent phosphoglycerate mutase [Lentisphaerota bacterium]MBT5604595.1 2,3-bisphosphoglycerate-independent phosphoglycerate mutase [Lentisphaerota bacterium]MBT7062202.1 2,3-bisphosphoglycerate-independent phosphoglycerate mutase [Lentisphaerota bacterium]MBT7845623.1 2,3-bisphosphoglycerate-independent phosphoglycerate mutase [Lentisphaerota bacterium]
MLERLSPASWMKRRPGPVLLAIMDGVGYGKHEQGDAVASALTPTLDWLHANCPQIPLKAHGKAVGLPSDEDMGNSEVGHNAIGSGRVFKQGAKLVSNSIATGAMFAEPVWQELVGNCKARGSALHFIGLFSDGNVHSHLDHLQAMLTQAKEDGVTRARVHILLDGRDVGETSALEYVDPFEDFLAGLNAAGEADFRIASGGGRMFVTMDRYQANWELVERGWETHVHGKGRLFGSAREAIETLRSETGAIDQDLPAFVIAQDEEPIGRIVDGDSVVFFNFRGDRALEITAAFEEDEFPHFDRGKRPDVLYAGMMEYDGDLRVPAKYLVSPPAIDRTMGEFLCQEGIRSMAISETQKYGHVTYFFNGNRSGKIDDELEEYVEIPSDILPFEQRPWMKAAEVTDEVLVAIESGTYDFIRLNFPNGDMVGHTGVYQAAQVAVETVDLCLGRLRKAIEAVGGVMIVSADHGNADDMYEHDKKSGAVKVENGSRKVKTAHSLNPVPCLVLDPSFDGEYETDLREGMGISSLAATCMNFLGFDAPEDYDPSVLMPR